MKVNVQKYKMKTSPEITMEFRTKAEGQMRIASFSKDEGDSVAKFFSEPHRGLSDDWELVAEYDIDSKELSK